MDERKKIKIAAVVGPTASGKTKLAVDICRVLNGEAVSCDSMQIYKYMDIATAKPTAQEMCGIPHHMLDFLEPGEKYSVAAYCTEAEQDSTIHHSSIIFHLPTRTMMLQYAVSLSAARKAKALKRSIGNSRLSTLKPPRSSISTIADGL